MATTSRKWFYSTPEPRPYYIEERVNHTLWKNRVQGIWLSCTQVADPIKMEGNWNGIPIFFEWDPGKHFTLRMGEERREMVGIIRQILLGLRPSFAYQDTEGMYVIEWHTDGGDARWKDIQGDPHFQGLRRLNRK